MDLHRTRGGHHGRLFIQHASTIEMDLDSDPSVHLAQEFAYAVGCIGWKEEGQQGSYLELNIGGG